MTHLDRRIKKMVLAGIGAAALAREESNGLLHELVKKGESIVESSGIRNEMLHRNTEEAIDSSTAVDSWLDTLSKMTPEQLGVLKDAINSLEWASETTSAEDIEIGNEEE